MTTHEVLVKARALIDTPEKWWQKGSSTMTGPNCALLALGEVDGDSETLNRYAQALVGDVKDSCNVLVKFNDSHSHAEVMALFDRAIAVHAPAPDMSWLMEPAAEYLVS